MEKPTAKCHQRIANGMINIRASSGTRKLVAESMVIYAMDIWKKRTKQFRIKETVSYTLYYMVIHGKIN